MHSIRTTRVGHPYCCSNLFSKDMVLLPPLSSPLFCFFLGDATVYLGPWPVELRWSAVVTLLSISIVPLPLAPWWEGGGDLGEYMFLKSADSSSLSKLCVHWLRASHAGCLVYTSKFEKLTSAPLIAPVVTITPVPLLYQVRTFYTVR